MPNLLTCLPNILINIIFKYMKQTVIIGTTAINRPELHTDIFPDWIEWINKLDREKYDIKWFVNIDIIDKLSPSFDETANNLINLSHEKINMDITKGSGNFLYACKRVSENIMNYCNTLDNKDNIKIIWLEDDWKFNKNVALDLHYLIETFSTNNSYINLTFIRNNYIWALAPCILGFNLWQRVHYMAWNNQKDVIDPEHCVGLYYLNNYEKEAVITNITLLPYKLKNNYNQKKYIRYENSRYSFYDLKETDKVEITERYLEPNKIQDEFKDKNVFVRISPTFCSDIGRQFMEKQNLQKTHVQTNTSTDFYK